MELTTGRDELLVEGSDRSFRELVHGLLALSALHEQVRNGHAAHIGLPGAQYTLLISIRHLQGGPVTVKRVAEHLRVSPTFVTAETNKLVLAGLISKERDPDDSRMVNLALTDLGSSELDRLAPVQRQVNDIQFAKLSHAEFVELKRLVETLVDNSVQAVELQRYLVAQRDREATPSPAFS